MSMVYRWFLSCMLLLVLTGCTTPVMLPTKQPTAVFPTPTTEPTPTAQPTPTAKPQPFTISAEANVPAELAQAARTIANQQPQFRWVEEPQTADLQLTLQQGQPLTTWHYVVAAPFATIPDDISSEEWATGWETGSNSKGAVYLTPETAAAWATVWRDSIPQIALVDQQNLRETLWQKRPSLTLLPFHQLTPDLKALTYNGRSPLDPTFEPTNYPLQLTISLVGAETAIQQFSQLWQQPASNYDPNKLTRLALTGVTALVRATAHQMEINGILYPGSDVKPVLKTADFAHVSNEVAFSPDCPYPNPIGGTTFCSRDSYFALLQDLGINIIELTGNHVNDWGRDSFLHTLDLYQQANIHTFGGGRNIAEASQPLQLSHNGNHIVLTGCNPFGPTYAWATADLAGSRPCDDSFTSQIQQLSAAGNLVFVTQQYAEYYHYAATAQQQADFRALIEAGATAVSGSQGHHAQGFELYNSGFIHYGLGNLFFDQMDMLGTRQTFIDTYTIYNGQLLNIALWTGLIENYARPRQMNPAEREQALQALFQASGW